MHKPYINICKILTSYESVNPDKVTPMWNNLETPTEPLTQIGFFDFEELHFEVYEGKGGHLPGEIVLIDYTNHIAITAGVLIFTGIFFVIAALTGNVEVEDPSQIPFSIAVMLIVCCGGGLALLIPWWRFRQIAGLYELYAPVVIHDDVEDIRQIAAVTGREFPRTRQELEQLIAFGALDGRYIDYENDILIWPNRPVVPQPKMIAKLCPHCSGQNQIPEGQTIRCAYCDSLIE